ncbi:MAG: Lpg1974 family pore-forming outer membrane protein [Verrucomicrobiota bacterium]
MKKYTLTLLLTAAPLFAGTPAPVAPAPQSNDQGITLGLEVLALRPYESEGSFDKSNYEAAFRGSLGYQFSDGLFVKGTYFGYNTSTAPGDDLTTQYVDLAIGQNFKPMEKLLISPFVGLRWASFKEDLDSLTFDGYGIVIGFDATRAICNNFSLYATAKESVLFGDTEYPKASDKLSHSTGLISEIGLGLQYDFCVSGCTGNARLGVEGQYWSGLSYSDTQDVSLAGFAFGLNFRF